MVPIRFWIPRRNRDELKAAAKAQTITMSSLLRILVLDFIRERHKRDAADG